MGAQQRSPEAWRRLPGRAEPDNGRKGPREQRSRAALVSRDPPFSPCAVCAYLVYACGRGYITYSGAALNFGASRRERARARGPRMLLASLGDGHGAMVDGGPPRTRPGSRYNGCPYLQARAQRALYTRPELMS